MRPKKQEYSTEHMNDNNSQLPSDIAIVEKQEHNMEHISNPQRPSDITLAEKQECNTEHTTGSNPQRHSDITQAVECNTEHTCGGNPPRHSDITLTENQECNMEQDGTSNTVRPSGSTPTRFPSIVAQKYRYHDPPQQAVPSEDTLAEHNTVEGAGTLPCSNTKAATGRISEYGTEEGTCSVPQQEDSTDDEDEEVESLPLEKKCCDPFWRKRIYNNIEGVEHSGIVIDIERGTMSKEKVVSRKIPRR